MDADKREIRMLFVLVFGITRKQFKALSKEEQKFVLKYGMTKEAMSLLPEKREQMGFSHYVAKYQCGCIHWVLKKSRLYSYLNSLSIEEFNNCQIHESKCPVHSMTQRCWRSLPRKDRTLYLTMQGGGNNVKLYERLGKNPNFCQLDYSSTIEKKSKPSKMSYPKYDTKWFLWNRSC